MFLHHRGRWKYSEKYGLFLVYASYKPTQKPLGKNYEQLMLCMFELFLLNSI